MKFATYGLLLVTVFHSALAGCMQEPAPQQVNHRSRRSLPTQLIANISPNNRTLCPETPENRPPNRVDTADRLIALRAAMAAHNPPLDGYLLEYRDEHGSGGSAHDMRMAFMSGCTTSAGYVWVTKERAALWTDGRYFLQADQQMDCNWILMEQGTVGYPSPSEWLLAVLEQGDNVGADPRYVSIGGWKSYTESLATGGISLVEVDDLVDTIWTEDRPERPNEPLIIHTLEFTGEHLSEKIGKIRTRLSTDAKEALVLTALDDTAWTFNLRGNDRDTSALFYSYAIITQDDVTLFLTNFEQLISPADVQSHLNTNADGTCTGIEGLCVQVKDYSSITTELENLASSVTGNVIWVTPESNYAILSAVSGKEHLENSPVQLMKSVKNEVERRRYYECQVRDSAALIEFVAYLEEQIQEGETWTELSASEKLVEIRRTYPHFHSVSFHSISAVGANAAVIHYRPSEDTDTQITQDAVYLLDSGGQYHDGTTDVTRTFHFGTPKAIEKEAYTRVLLGAIELSLSVWPFPLRGSELDIRARSPLFENGWNYRHGTGHGIGYFLNVHEGPGRINLGYNPDHAPLTEGMFFSDEPGYYEDGQYGIRLETIVGVEEADTPNKFDDATYLTFREATLVPFEPNLIDYDLLETRHRKWINQYNKRCLEETGAYLQEHRPQDQRAYDWLAARTAHISEVPNWEDVDASDSGNMDRGGIPLLAFLLTCLFAARWL